MREESESLWNTDPVFAVTDDMIELIKQRAAAEPRLRYRISLHRGPDEAVQEMIIAACRDAVFTPHKHPGRESSFSMIEGRMSVILFDDDGNVTDRIEMAPPGGGLTAFLKLEGGRWHSVSLHSETAVFHETAAGPYIPGEAMLVAEWAGLK